MNNGYTLYHCHSDYSLLDSTTSYKDYIDLAVKYGQKAISISEHGKPLGWVAKKLYCDKLGIKYMHSVEVYLTETLEEKIRDNYHTVLIARNFEGVLELNKLVSKSCDQEHFYYTNRVTFDEFLNTSGNIIATSACLASPLNKLPKDHPKYMKLVQRYDYLEIQPHIHPDQIGFNKQLYELSMQYGIPLIAGTDTHSSSQYKAECRSVLTTAKRKNYGDEDAFDLSYKTYDELVDMFVAQGALPYDVIIQAIENTNVLADSVESFELDRAIKYPILYGSREADAKKFVEIINSKLEDKLAKGIIPPEQECAFREAIAEELRVFQKLHMDGFMLSMSELISWCKRQDMAIGTARGSVGGSRIAYVTDIIDLNPETWHTVFSRFCNEDREEIGDIDIDCIESDRPAIFRYITDRFGADKTARVAAFGTIAGRSAVDEIGRCLRLRWELEHTGEMPKNTAKCSPGNPYTLAHIDEIKREFDADLEKARKKYPKIFYYYDGLVGTKVSQSVHPAGMVISPITLDDNYGVFDKDGELCLMMDMEEAHEVGVAKYDFLVLKTVQVIRDTCKGIGIPYPKTHEIDWNDEKVWGDIVRSPAAIFQFESPYAFDCLKKFKPKNIFDMSLVTACIRPSGKSYRDKLLERKPHHNPSEMIDELLKDNLGYLIYQEDTIKFLQQICGLSGSDADNIRRAIGRKQKDRLDAALPSILEGYCNKSDKPREQAEQEAKEFLQVIEDSASYQFGYNHTIAYCLLGYLCAYYRYYYPVEFLTAFLNNAANDEDIQSGTEFAKKVGIKIIQPKFGYAKSQYFFNTDERVISKGVSSIKYLNGDTADKLYDLSQNKIYDTFIDLLGDMYENTAINSRQVDVLIKTEYFSRFGNQKELLRICELFEMFKRGSAKTMKKSLVGGSPIEEIIKKYSIGKTKTGADAKSYTFTDVKSMMIECEKLILSVGMSDISDVVKVKNFADVMGYAGYVSGKEEDRRKLYIKDVFPLKRKRDGKQFGYSIITQSVGSGVESRFTVFNTLYNTAPIKKGDIILCLGYDRDGQYFTLRGYKHIT